MSTLTHCIGDGYTRKDCYIAEEPKIHAALDGFDYRPCLAMQRQAYHFRISKASALQNDAGAKELGKIAYDIVTNHVVNLTLIDAEGNPHPTIIDGKVTERGKKLIIQMEPTLLITLQNICMGLSTPDDRPEPSNQQQEGDKPRVDLTTLDDEPTPFTPLEGELILEAQSAGN